MKKQGLHTESLGQIKYPFKEMELFFVNRLFAPNQKTLNNTMKPSLTEHLLKQSVT